jgi:hypothetical protein
MNRPGQFTADAVRSSIQAAIITTGSGDGSNEREEIDYEWLARHLNDLVEQATATTPSGVDSIAAEARLEEAKLIRDEYLDLGGWELVNKTDFDKHIADLERAALAAPDSLANARAKLPPLTIKEFNAAINLCLRQDGCTTDELSDVMPGRTSFDAPWTLKRYLKRYRRDLFIWSERLPHKKKSRWRPKLHGNRLTYFVRQRGKVGEPGEGGEEDGRERPGDDCRR